jgi:hypothetical protein
MTILSKVRFRGTWLRKCAKRGSGVGHGRELGDDRKQRTDGESCVMSLPPLHVFRFHYAAFQTLRRVQWLCIDP